MIWIKAKEKKCFGKAAKGRQILVNSQFENQASVEKLYRRSPETLPGLQQRLRSLQQTFPHDRSCFSVSDGSPRAGKRSVPPLIPKYCHFPAFRICAPVFTAFWISYKDPCFISHSLRYPVCCSRQYATCPQPPF